MSRNVGKGLKFDIRDYAPDHVGDTARDKENRTKTVELYRHINFMVHLTWDIPYYSDNPDSSTNPTIHGSVKWLATRMKFNLQEIWWPSQFSGAVDVVVPHLDAILALSIVDSDSVTVANLFTADARRTPAMPPDDRYPVVQQCVAMRLAAYAYGYDICLPFITIQGERRHDSPPTLGHKNSWRQLVRFGDLTKYGARLRKRGTPSDPLGDYLTMKDVFVTPKNELIPDDDTDPENVKPSGSQAISWMRDNGVFRPKQKPNTNDRSPLDWLGTEASSGGEAGIRSGGQGNNYQCIDGRCQFVPNHFCSYDSAGNCSAMSPPPPP